MSLRGGRLGAHDERRTVGSPTRKITADAMAGVFDLELHDADAALADSDDDDAIQVDEVTALALPL